MKATNPQHAKIPMNRSQAAALLSAVEIALQANGGKAPPSVSDALYEIVERINEAFDFGIGEIADEPEYRIAFMLDATGDWEIIEAFRAADDAAANAYAEEHYPDQDWYVLDAAGRNINSDDQD